MRYKLESTLTVGGGAVLKNANANANGRSFYSLIAAEGRFAKRPSAAMS